MLFNIFSKKKEQLIIDNGENQTDINYSTFTQSNILINGNQNKIDFSECDTSDSNLSVSGESNIIDFKGCDTFKSKLNIVGDSNKIDISKVKINNVTIDVTGSNNTVTIEEGTLISGGMEIVINGNNHQITIGEYVHIYGKLSFWVVDNDTKIVIGNYSTFGIANISIAEPNTEIIMGRDCMVANGVSIKNSDFHSIIDLNTNQRINPSKNIKIGNHVWLGENCHILKDVTIEDNSIVALGSIVTKDVPSNCVVAGNPTKVIKENISWSRERIPN